VSADREVYVLDTPGVMAQRVASIEEGLKLSLAGGRLVAVGGSWWR
jgi:hypothetical protein